jgi:hypothetical protein
MRSRQRSAGIAAALCAVLVSTTAFAVAASAEEPIAPTTVEQKLELLTEEAREVREYLGHRYPLSQMPSMSPVQVVADGERPERMARCAEQFRSEAGTRWDAAVAPGLYPRSLPDEVIERTCELRYPAESSLQYVLGTYELRQLWAYYVFGLQPCLRRIGVQTVRSPSFGEYLATRGTEDAWHPYLGIPNIVNIRDLNYYDEHCPRFPEWLRA